VNGRGVNAFAKQLELLKFSISFGFPPMVKLEAPDIKTYPGVRGEFPKKKLFDYLFVWVGRRPCNNLLISKRKKGNKKD
jgi:hypothetical protein